MYFSTYCSTEPLLSCAPALLRYSPSLSTPHRPHVEVAAGLNVAAHVAIPHIDDPRDVRAAGVGSRRPIAVGLHIDEALRI